MAESNRQNEWNTRFEEVKAFAEANKRWPSTTAENEQEKAIGQWWSRQKYLCNKKAENKPAPGLSDERESLLKSLIDSHSSFERDGVWQTKYQVVLDKFKADGKLWAYATQDPEQQKNIRWWNQQKTFARKFKANPNGNFGGMTQERFDKVLSLISQLGQELGEISNEPSADKTSDTTSN